MKTVTDFIFLGSKITAEDDCSHEIKRCLLFGRKAIINLDSILKNRDMTANIGPSSQNYGFSSSHVWKWNHNVGWVPKNWCFWTTVLEKTLGSPLNCKDIQPFNPRGTQPWLFIGKTDAEAHTLASWWEKTTHLQRSWCWERLNAGGKGSTEGELGHGFEETLGDSERQPGLVCCNPKGQKESDTTKWLNSNKDYIFRLYIFFLIASFGKNVEQ